MAAPKSCIVCGREIEWRRKWARDWEHVRYCSSSCRRSGVSALDRKLEEAILSLLAARGRDVTICPSEAARAVLPDGWRDEMDRVRRAACRLASQGAIEVTQGGHVVDPSRARGPIRLRRSR